MKTSWKPLGRSLLLVAQKKIGQQSARESIVDDGLYGRPKEADENIKVVHTFVMCDRKRDL